MTLSLVHDADVEPDVPNRRGYVGFKPAPFDYSTLAANLASAARDSAERIRQSQRDHIIEVGLELLKIKELLAHGHSVAEGGDLDRCRRILATVKEKPPAFYQAFRVAVQEAVRVGETVGEVSPSPTSAAKAPRRDRGAL